MGCARHQRRGIVDDTFGVCDESPEDADASSRRCRDRVVARARLRPDRARHEREHGGRPGMARRRSVPAAAKRTVHCGVFPQRSSSSRRRQRLPHGRSSRPARRQADRRCVARRLQVVRRRTHLEEHAASRLSAGHICGRDRVAAQGLRRRRRSARQSGIQRIVRLFRDRVSARGHCRVHCGADRGGRQPREGRREETEEKRESQGTEKGARKRRKRTKGERRLEAGARRTARARSGTRPRIRPRASGRRPATRRRAPETGPRTTAGAAARWSGRRRR